MTDEQRYVTKTGKVLTDADIEALANEAEQGYDTSQLQPRKSRKIWVAEEGPHGTFLDDNGNHRCNWCGSVVGRVPDAADRPD